jgi:TolB-like protein
MARSLISEASSMHFAAPSMCRMAVPFANLSGDPEQEFFADGLAEDIITTLSKLSGLRVIARNSSFTASAPQKASTPRLSIGRRPQSKGGDRCRALGARFVEPSNAPKP